MTESDYEYEALVEELRCQGASVLSKEQFIADKTVGRLDLSRLRIRAVPECVCRMPWVHIVDISDNGLDSTENWPDNVLCVVNDQCMRRQPNTGWRIFGGLAFGLGTMALLVVLESISGEVYTNGIVVTGILAFMAIWSSRWVPVTITLPLALILCEMLPYAWANGHNVDLPGVSLMSLLIPAIYRRVR